MVSSTPRPLFTPGKEPVPILQEAGWAPGPVLKGGKSRPHGDSIPDRTACSQSLYRLSYRAHILGRVQKRSASYVGRNILKIHEVSNVEANYQNSITKSPNSNLYLSSSSSSSSSSCSLICPSSQRPTALYFTVGTYRSQNAAER